MKLKTWHKSLLLLIIVVVILGAVALPYLSRQDDVEEGVLPVPTPRLVRAASATPTASVTPTASPSATFTASPSATPTSTFLPGTPTAIVPTFTPSLTPSITPTASATPTTGPTITPTHTVTPTLRPTLTPTPEFTPTPAPTLSLSADVMNVLVIGVDRPEVGQGENTDTIIVVSVNRANGAVTMLSIPRDLWVFIPSSPTGTYSRINTAHRTGIREGYPGGGMGLLSATIEHNFGIPIHHWVRVDLRGFVRAVDTLGGVTVAVPCTVNLRYRAPETISDTLEIIMEPGVYRMDGATALRYVRTRRGVSDFERSRRQQLMLKALWKEALRLDVIPKIPSLWDTLHASIDTDLGLGDILSLAPMALGIKSHHIRSRYIDYYYTADWITADGWQVLLPIWDRIYPMLEVLTYPPPAAGDRLEQEGARVIVLNGTSRPQVEMLAADRLRWEGFNIVSTGPDQFNDHPYTRIVVLSDKPEALARLADLLAVAPENILHLSEPETNADLKVILGADYDPCDR